ncbi:hypothetical protein [Halomicronema sp. CCY15110]|uniref:hypothetical protein n=1 Tax=Halomicronema sp. CCY15110 TaxID=2767773 RepID=UPI0019515185|nr:hypothetical protein [Halomicronema sp. CCY15110]
MNAMRISFRLAVMGTLSGAILAVGDGWQGQAAIAQSLTLGTGFSPNPTTLAGTGGGDRPAAAVVNTASSPTGPCLGYISTTPHEEVVLEANFANLEMRVESALDTTLVISGPGGVWCNDDSGSKNPAIAGAWLPGTYRVWVGAYRPEQTPDYTLFIQDRS